MYKSNKTCINPWWWYNGRLLFLFLDFTWIWWLVFGRHGYRYGVNVSYMIYRVNLHSNVLFQHSCISYKDNTYNADRKSIQIDLKWLFWDKIWSILNWCKHTEDKMVKLKVLLVRRSYTLEYDTWNGILARVLQSWSGLGEGYDTWGYHISTYIIQEYIISENTHWVCELIICAHNHTIQNTIYVIIWI